ncbi:hypothetical protein AVEN_200457-1 [Araneus ventricosus]|uniref:Uncharacterized protein n=1 Tax=Araneus ventricosus TaxID=182803 RepID=A0A4Y2JHJ4_ARAVE|nr:hypothetical protein AVEN_200457-1 [Araneus ventricosus]
MSTDFPLLPSQGQTDDGKLVITSFWKIVCKKLRRMVDPFQEENVEEKKGGGAKEGRAQIRFFHCPKEDSGDSG